VCNCSAMVDTLLESQLFGHERGSFTGATDTRLGLFEYANGGTVFLDEVGETSLAMQAKLLRVIQNREIQRVGSPEVRRINVRLIAATNRDLRAECWRGIFAKIFFPVEFHPDPRSFVGGAAGRYSAADTIFPERYNGAYGKSISGLTRRAQTVLLRHPWPGNVRELENVISSACITATGDFIECRRFTGAPAAPEYNVHGRRGWKQLSLDEMCMLHVQRVLGMCQGDRRRRRTFWGLGARLYTGTSHAIGRPSTLTKSPRVPSLESEAQAQAGYGV